MKSTELTTMVVKLNWNYIIDHATDRKFWEQKFKVYDIEDKLEEVKSEEFEDYMKDKLEEL